MTWGLYHSKLNGYSVGWQWDEAVGYRWSINLFPPVQSWCWGKTVDNWGTCWGLGPIGFLSRVECY
jgi:hypothetical protein